MEREVVTCIIMLQHKTQERCKKKNTFTSRGIAEKYVLLWFECTFRGKLLFCRFISLHSYEARCVYAFAKSLGSTTTFRSTSLETGSVSWISMGWPTIHVDFYVVNKRPMMLCELEIHRNTDLRANYFDVQLHGFVAPQSRLFIVVIFVWSWLD